jgi:hypothetical protein
LYSPVILVLRRVRKDDLKFKVSHGYIARPCLQKEGEGGRK